MADTLKNVSIYTDGAAEPNPGPGGYGAVLLSGAHRRELSGGFRLTTNNRMELKAAIVALEALKSLCKVTLYSDSKYLVNAMSQGWVQKWQAKDFLKKGFLMVNADLWKRLAELCELHRVRFEWVKGHAGEVENERCDALAMAALQLPDLPPDEGYEEELRFARKRQPGGMLEDLPQTRQSEDSYELEDSPPDPIRPPPAKKPPKTMEAGQPCPKCGTPLDKRTPKKRGRGAYYYEWYLLCPGCGTQYMVEAAKRFTQP